MRTLVTFVMKISQDENTTCFIGTDGSGKAGDCIKCGKCEAQCPQHLEIRKLLEEAADIYEKEMHL